MVREDAFDSLHGFIPCYNCNHPAMLCGFSEYVLMARMQVVKCSKDQDFHGLLENRLHPKNLLSVGLPSRSAAQLRETTDISRMEPPLCRGTDLSSEPRKLMATFIFWMKPPLLTIGSCFRKGFMKVLSVYQAPSYPSMNPSSQGAISSLSSRAFLSSSS